METDKFAHVQKNQSMLADERLHVELTREQTITYGEILSAQLRNGATYEEARKTALLGVLTEGHLIPVTKSEEM